MRPTWRASQQRRRDKDSFKLDVRKLENLGLTHSLETGYEVSPRGVAYLRATAG